jgi:hypothetical protein
MKECKGCFFDGMPNFYICTTNELKPVKNSSKDLCCPCQTCLFKGICKSSCEPFLRYLYNRLTSFLGPCKVNKILDQLVLYEAPREIMISHVQFILLCIVNNLTKQEDLHKVCKIDYIYDLYKSYK